MFGPYTAFIVPSYLISAAVIIGLIAWTNISYHRRLREIAELERQGVQRRSQAGGNG
jgi:heme exporter protein CcmD